MGVEAVTVLEFLKLCREHDLASLSIEIIRDDVNGDDIRIRAGWRIGRGMPTIALGRMFDLKSYEHAADFGALIRGEVAHMAREFEKSKRPIPFPKWPKP